MLYAISRFRFQNHCYIISTNVYYISAISITREVNNKFIIILCCICEFLMAPKTLSNFNLLKLLVHLII